MIRLREGPLLICSFTDEWREWKNRKGLPFKSVDGEFTGYGLFAALSYDPKVAAFAKETGAYYQELPGEPIKLYKAALYGRFPDWEKVARLKERARQSFDLALGEGVPIKGSGRG